MRSLSCLQMLPVVSAKREDGFCCYLLVPSVLPSSDLMMLKAHSADLSLSLSFFPSVALDKASFKTGSYCEVCKMAVTYIDKLLEKNATEEEIEEAVRKVCSFLPDSMKKQVKELPLLNLPSRLGFFFFLDVTTRHTAAPCIHSATSW